MGGDIGLRPAKDSRDRQKKKKKEDRQIDRQADRPRSQYTILLI